MIKQTGSYLKRGLSKAKRTFFKVINIFYWLDWTRVKGGALYLKNALIRLFSTKKEKKSQSFKAAVSEFHLSEEELIIKQKSLLRLSLIMIGAASLIFLYSIYQLFYGSWHAALISLVVCGIALVLAFRYHFWYFQIKNRKLGCSFQEWYAALKGGKNE